MKLEEVGRKRKGGRVEVEGEREGGKRRGDY